VAELNTAFDQSSTLQVPNLKTKLSTPPLHLYLHIPFCHRICPYCSFYKHTPGDTDLAGFIDGLIAEARRRAAELEGPDIKTLYLGGGTPSMLSPTHLRRLFEGLRESFALSDAEEISLEANPATFARETADTYAEIGVTRVSLGAQSFHPDHLVTLGRQHSPEDIAKSATLLRCAGFTNISIDLMFSIPGQSLADWEHTLEQALTVETGHLSAYNLTYEEDTPFFESFQNGDYRDDPDLNAQMFELAHEKLTTRGYHHYETSNYGLEDRESLHNQAYWEGADYLGLGPSAVSTISGRRWKNVPDTTRYLHQIERVGHAETEVENLTAEQFDLERIALMLRTERGVPKRHLGIVRPERIEQVISEDLAEFSAENLRLIGRGPLLVDSIVEHLVS
jgi:oxygen-independent coproporphyrinogen-3 oxidase